jgi:tetratricopeptide (TPR) repeat protein
LSASLKKLIKIFVSIGLFLRANRSGLIIGIIASTIVTLFFLLILPPYNDQIPEPEPLITQKEAAIIEELLVLSNSTVKYEIDFKNEPPFKQIIDHLSVDPYNVNAHVMLGQLYALFENYRGALSEFQEATNIDETLADPHFGIGSAYYDLAILDMIERDRYEIYDFGTIYDINNGSSYMITYPNVKFNPDKRTEILFTMALDEFNKAMKLQKSYKYVVNATLTLYPSDYITERMLSIRRYLRLEPFPRDMSDDPSAEVFSNLILDINPDLIVFYLNSTDVIPEGKEVASMSDIGFILQILVKGQFMLINNSSVPFP